MKRFATGACRARHSRGARPAAKAVELEATTTAQDRLETMEELYRRLVADVLEHGTLLDTGLGGKKANPSVTALVKVIAELNRIAPADGKVDDEPVDLLSLLKTG